MAAADGEGLLLAVMVSSETAEMTGGVVELEADDGPGLPRSTTRREIAFSGAGAATSELAAEDESTPPACMPVAMNWL